MKGARFFLASALFLLAACGQKEPKSVEYYQSNPDELMKRLVVCNDDHSLFSSDQDCINAFLADEVSSVEYWKKNPAQRKLQVEFCSNYVATIGKSGNCINAAKAQKDAFGAGGNPVYLTPPDKQ